MKTIKIEGMMCEHCAAHVKEALQNLGLDNINVSLEDKSASFDLIDSVTDEMIKSAISEEGYEVISID